MGFAKPLEVELDAEKYGLDEDGVVYINARPSARDFINAQKLQEEYGNFGLVTLLITGWSLKVNGEFVEYSKEAVLDLPVDILNKVVEEVAETPLFKGSLSAAD